MSFNYNSSTQVSQLLYGGILQLEEHEEIGVYISGARKGQPKFKKVIKEVKIKGLGLNPSKEDETKKKGIYKVGEQTLQLIATTEESWVNQDAKQICRLLLNIRGIKKQLSTYYESTLEYLDKNDFIHPQFNHTSTGTGRLSCTRPNVQNQPANQDSKVLEHFISRFEDGVLISADYSQIEPRTEAQLSQDLQYIQDITNELDVHIKNLALKERIDYFEAAKNVEESDEWKQKRKKVKGFSFVQQYGGGALKTQAASGLTLDEIKTIKENRQNEYSRLYQWHEELQKEVDIKGVYKMFTGRIYRFKKYPAKYDWQKRKGIVEDYSYTQIMNFKTQGTATADLVLIMLGKFWRERGQFKRDKYLLINTVHDSVMLDCKNEHIEEAKKDVQTLTRIKLMCYNEFNYNWIVPIKIDISIGGSWYEL